MCSPSKGIFAGLFDWGRRLRSSSSAESFGAASSPEAPRSFAGAAPEYVEVRSDSGSVRVKVHAPKYDGDTVAIRLAFGKRCALEVIPRRNVHDPFFEEEAPDTTFREKYTQEGSVAEHSYSMTAHPGTCTYMQDRTLVSEFEIAVGSKNYHALVFAVFDGHGKNGAGEEAAEFTRDSLALLLKKKIEARHKKQTSLNQTAIYNAIVKVFFSLNVGYYVSRQKDQGGTTVSLAMKLNGVWWTAHVGDSCVVYCKDGRAIKLTREAKPRDPYFHSLIAERGGQTTSPGDFYLFNPDGDKRQKLAMVTSIGDFHLGKTRKGVFPHTEEPMIACWEGLEPGGKFILQTDGVSDVLTLATLAKMKEICSENIVFSALRTRERLLEDQYPDASTRKKEKGLDIDNTTALVVDCTGKLERKKNALPLSERIVQTHTSTS